MKTTPIPTGAELNQIGATLPCTQGDELALGVPELGAILSCNRDAASIAGFNPDVALTRTQTLMGGASHCDFRYARQPQA